MHFWLAVALLFLKLPFWETHAPEQWTDLEVDEMLSDSPWAQALGPPPAVVVYFATAAPILAAESEERRRGHAPPRPDFDYSDYLRQHAGECVVLSIPYSPRGTFGTPEQQRRMQDESVMHLGRATYQILGYFPPAKNDPLLRLVFPKPDAEGVKSIAFHLYLPGMGFPERDVEFKLKDLLWHGRLEM